MQVYTDVYGYLIVDSMKINLKHISLTICNTKGQNLIDILPLKYTHSENYYWAIHTRNPNGLILTFKDSNKFWRLYTYDDFGNILSYTESTGVWSKYTRDHTGKELTYSDSFGTTRGVCE